MSAHAHRTKCCKNVIRKLHNNSELIGLMALLQTFRNIKKYCNLLSVLQAQTHTNCPKTRTYRFLFYKYKYIDGR